MKNNKIIYILFSIIIFWLIILTFYKPSENNGDINIIEENVSGFSTDLTKVAQQRQAAVITLISDNNISSAFFYKKGENNLSYFVTTYHGIGEYNELLFASGYRTNCELFAYDPFADLAVLTAEIPYTIAEVSFGDASLLEKGEFLLAFGTAIDEEYSGSVSLALVSSPLRNIENEIIFDGERYDYNLFAIQLSSSLLPAYSGGPLFNMNGELVGMTTFQNKNDSSLSFALTANEIKICVDKLLNDIHFNRVFMGYKGVLINSLEDYEKAALAIPLDELNGFYINDIKNNSLAYNAGLRANDLLLVVNDKEIKTLDDLLQISYEPQQQYKFVILRDRERIELNFSLNDD